jgi:trimeric autotransporter adhesin
MKLIASIFLLCIAFTSKAQNVGIGTITPDASAKLEISAANKGLLIPRVNLLSPTDVATVPTPATGLLVINTNSNVLQMPDGGGIYAYTGSKWVKLLLNEGGTNTQAWTTKGNAGTNASINFLGTTDNAPLVFKTNNGFAGKIDITSSLSIGRGALINNAVNKINTAFGDSALFNTGIGAVAVSDATENTGFGYKTLYANTTGTDNTAMGHLSLASNTTGFYNSAFGRLTLFSNTTGDGNTTFGTASLNSNTTGSTNSAFGSGALGLNTSGYSNVAVGVSALQKNTVRNHLVAVGDSALHNNGVGATAFSEAQENTAVGSKALYTNTTGTDNTAVGYLSLYSNNNGFYNTATGRQSLFSNSGGFNNTAIGNSALFSNTIGSSNVAAGSGALFNNTYASNNTAIGSVALSANTIGYSNVAVGAGALNKNRTKNNLVAVGDSALFNNYEGSGFSVITWSTNNTAIGSKALLNNTIGNDNTAVGYLAGYSNTDGTENTATGLQALYSNTSGVQNTALGNLAGYSTQNNYGTYVGYHAGRYTNGVSNTYIGWGAGNNPGIVVPVTGGDNVCIGVRSGQGITGGSQNITVGNSVNTGVLALTNTVTIGHNISNSQNNSVVLGNGSITKWGFGVNTGAANILEFNNAVTTARLTTGGVWTNASDKNIKTNFTLLDKKEMLNRIMQLPITRWNYLSETTATHILAQWRRIFIASFILVMMIKQSALLTLPVWH